MHADTPDRHQLPQGLEILAEIRIGLIDIAVASSQGFIVIPDFVAHGCDFPDDSLVPTLRNSAEIVDAEHALLRLQTRCPQGIPGQ